MFKTLFIFLIIFSSFYCATAEGDYFFRTERVSNQLGLSQNKVNSIERDHLGYIWIGTEHGLNRFDGFEIRKYFSDFNSSASLWDNFIRFIHHDDNQNLWVGTIKGLNKYDPRSDKFIRIDPDGISRGFSSVIETGSNLVFFTETFEIVIYNKQKSEFRFLKLSDSGIHLDNLTDINFIAPWNNDKFLTLIRSKGLCLIDIISGKVELLLPMPEGRFNSMLTTKENIFLVDLQKGILKINRQTLSVENPGLSLPFNLITSFEQHPETKDFWVTTDGSGVFILDEKFRIKKHVQTGPGIMNILPDNTVFKLFFDCEDIWLGTVRSGAIYLHPADFEHFAPANGTPYGPSEKSVLTFCEDQNGTIWLGTDGGGISRFDKTASLFEHFVTEKTRKITSIIDYDEHRLLIASYRQGLFFFDKRNHLFYPVTNDPLLKQIYSSTRIKLFRDKHSNIWISGAAIWRINTAKNEIRQFSAVTDPEVFKDINSIYYSVHEDLNGNLWFSSEGGIFSFNFLKNKMENPLSLNNLKRSYGRVVYSITSTKQGEIIFGSDQGLFMYNPATRVISDILSNNESESRIYYTLYTSADNQLWTATSEGLIQFKKNQQGNFQPLHHKSAGNFEYRFGSLLKSKDGYVYFGGNEGFVRFRPEKIKSDTVLIKPIITSFHLRATERNTPKDSLIIPFVSDSASVTLSYTTSSYEFEFNAFDFAEKDQVLYQYRLENFEEVWRDGKSRKAIYTSLPAGKYVFMVKAANGSGLWNTTSTKLYLNILPRWWQTIWFKFIIIAIILATSIYIWLESLSTAKLRNQLKLEILEQDKLKEINQMKLRFFTNISHELKTPLTLIYAPLEQMVRRHSNAEELNKLLPFLFRNAKRMNQLVTQLLEFRKAEMDELHLNLEKADLVAECREILNYFSHQAVYEGINLTFNTNLEHYQFVCDKDKLFKMLSNLLSNAMKHTSEGGSIELRLSRGNSLSAIISVSDTGTGFPEEERLKIFDRYYQVDHKEAGTGIGLAFIKHLVELHQGKIDVVSSPGEGSTFTITLPFNPADVSPPILKSSQSAEKISETEINDLPETDQKKPDTFPVMLIAEDEWELRKYLEQLFKNQFNILIAKNGEEAFSKVLKHSPDLILTDLMMPVLDGYGLCKKVKNDLRVSHIPVVMLTAKSELEDQIEGYKSGADAYIPKPFDNQLLFTQIEAILRNRIILKERFNHDMDISPEELSQSPADEKYLHKAIRVVEMNLANEKFNVDEFVNEMGMSRTLVYNKTKAITGKPVKDFILHIRLRKASEHLKQTNKNITEIAIACGFADPAYFSTVFKRYYNITPTEYRNKK